MKIWDITRIMEDNMPVYPGDPPFVRRTLPGVGVTIASLSMGSHCGTHLDAPAHLLPNGATVDLIPLERLLIPAYVVAAPSLGAIPAELVEKLHDIREKAVLFKSPAHDSGSLFLQPETAAYLVKEGAGLVGIDTASVDAPDAPGLPIHRFLLKAGVLIMEGLDLRGVMPGAYQLAALPLLIRDGDGAPVRAVLYREEEHG